MRKRARETFLAALNDEVANKGRPALVLAVSCDYGQNLSSTLHELDRGEHGQPPKEGRPCCYYPTLFNGPSLKRHGKSSGALRPGGIEPSPQEMIAVVDEHREAYGVESICAELPIAPSTHYEHQARECEPERGPERHQHDVWLLEEIRRVYHASGRRYGARKLWRQLGREGIRVARYLFSGKLGAFTLYTDATL